MKLYKRRRLLLFVLVLPLVCLLPLPGCREADEKPRKEIFEEVSSRRPTLEDDVPSEQEPAAAPAPPAPSMPEVNLTEKAAAESRLGVGELMPNAALRDMAGQPVELRSLFGPKATVVCFWNAGRLSQLQAIEELDKYVARPYAEQGVAVIGINVGDSPQDVRHMASLAEARFAMLLDPNSRYFKKIAVETLPRVYLLNADGEVLWFDIDYSRSMRRDLLQGIDVVLEKQ